MGDCVSGGQGMDVEDVIGGAILVFLGLPLYAVMLAL